MFVFVSISVSKLSVLVSIDLPVNGERVPLTTEEKVKEEEEGVDKGATRKEGRKLSLVKGEGS